MAKKTRWLNTDLKAIRRDALQVLAEGPILTAALIKHLNTTKELLLEALGDDVDKLTPEKTSTRAEYHYYTDEQIFDALRTTAKLNGGVATVLKFDEYRALGKITAPTATRLGQRYGKWTKACELAGVTPGVSRRPTYEKNFTDQQLWSYVYSYIESTDNPTSTGYSVWRENEAPEAPTYTTIRHRLGKWTEIYPRAVTNLKRRQKRAA